MRKDSILQNYYFKKLPAAKKGGAIDRGETPNLNKIIKDNLDKTGHIPNKVNGKLPTTGWVDQYMNNTGTYTSDKATQVGQYEKGGQKCPKGYINIDGKCIKLDSAEYRNMLDKGQVGTMQNGKFWGNKSTLPPVVIYNSKDKNTQKFYDKLKKGNPEKYQALLELGQKYGSPHVSLKEKAGTLDFLDPNAFNTKEQNQEGYYRPHYNPNQQRIYLGANQDNSDLRANYIAELAHQKQVMDKGALDFNLRALSGFGRVGKNMVKNFESPVDAYSNEYNTPGSLEYQAHKEIEPKLQDEYINLLSDKDFAADYYKWPGTFSNDKPKKSYKKGGGYFPEYHSYTAPRMNNGGGINLNLPRIEQPNPNRLFPYAYNERPDQYANIFGAGVQGSGRINDRLNVNGGINLQHLSVPIAGISEWKKPTFNVGVNYRFENGGDPSIPDLQEGNWLSKYQTGRQVGDEQDWGTAGNAAWTVAQIADPTGILSWPDAYRGWRDMIQHPSLKNFGSALLNTAAAIPVVGKGAKAAVVAEKAAKGWKELNALQKAGRVVSEVGKGANKIIKPVVESKVAKGVNKWVGKPLSKTLIHPIATIDKNVGLGHVVGAVTANAIKNAPRIVKGLAPVTTAINRGARWDKLMEPAFPVAIDAISSGLNKVQDLTQGSSDVEATPTERPNFTVEYFDPKSKKTVSKQFATNEQADNFYNDPNNNASSKYSNLATHKNGGQPCYNCGGMYKNGGSPNWLNKYQVAGPVKEKQILAPAATESTARSFHNPILGAATNTATTGYTNTPIQNKKPIVPFTAANNFGLGNPRDIMGKNTSSSTQAPPLYNSDKIKDINTSSALGQRQQQTLVNAGQNKSAAKYAVANKKFTGNQQDLLNKRAELEHDVMLHKDYDSTKSIEQQSGLADDKSLGTKIWRGSRSHDSNNPIQNLAWDVMSAPGKAAVNIGNAGEYLKQGWGAIPNIALDMISVFPGIGEAAAGTIRGLAGSFGKNVIGQAERGLLQSAGTNLAHAEAPAIKQLGTHMGEHFGEGIGHQGVHKGFHELSGEHSTENHATETAPMQFAANNVINPLTGTKRFKTGGWIDDYNIPQAKEGLTIDKGKKKSKKQKVGNNFVDLKKTYNLDPFSKEGIAKAQELTKSNPNTRIICTAAGCSEIAVNAAHAFGHDFKRSNAWDLGNQNKIIATNPVYRDLIGKGVLPDPTSYISPESVYNHPGAIIGLNRRNNLVGGKATTKEQADDSFDYANQTLYPGSRGYEHSGYMIDSNTMLHGTGAGGGHPAYYVIDPDVANGVQLTGYGNYQPVESMMPNETSWGDSFKQGYKNLRGWLGFEYGGMTPDIHEGWLNQYDRGGMITDPRGQWAHPGKNTRIPGGNITMQGVPYPVLAKASNGMSTVMQPGKNYNFQNATHVDEYPLIKRNGGEPNWLGKYIK